MADHVDPTDALFLERLEVFLQKGLSEIRAFADRERYSFEETRRLVAEWHCKYLFQRFPTSTEKDANDTGEDRLNHIRSVLCHASRSLESLHGASGIHSFILAVDPKDPSESGFLGGTAQGREFWRGFRGGGTAGVKTFKIYCIKNANVESTETSELPCLLGLNVSPSGVPPTKRTPASSLKAELYSTVRDALRLASGIRNAEMKWSNHDRLGVYGVQIVGWPASVPKQNPSSLTASQNKLLLESLQNGTMKFIAKEENSKDAKPAPEAEQHETLDPHLPFHTPVVVPEESPPDLSWVSQHGEPSSQKSSGYSNPLPEEQLIDNANDMSVNLSSVDLSNMVANAYPRLEPSGVPILRLGSPGEATHYLDSESNYRLIDWDTMPTPTSRKRRREDLDPGDGFL